MLGQLTPEGTVVAANGRVMGRRHQITGAIRPMRSTIRPDGIVEGADGQLALPRTLPLSMHLPSPAAP